jgi:two-component system, cell cycle response regulator DivK
MPPATVLVVDDHTDSRTICEIILARSGYGILSAADGARGLELAREQRPAVIILDIALPRMDGWAVLDELQKEPETAAIPVVMCTAHSFESYRVRALSMGCAAFLVKPCSPQTILEAVQGCLPTPPSTGSPVPELA